MSDPIRVLICEDQQLMRAGYVTILGAQSDVEVVDEAGDGHVAVEMAGRVRPDVVVMDLQMPARKASRRQDRSPDPTSPTGIRPCAPDRSV